MKFSKIFRVLIFIYCFFIFSGVLINITSSLDEYYSISISEKNYDFIRREEIKGRIMEYYNITIILKNSGNIESDDITIEIVGKDEIPLYNNGSIPAGNSKVFNFDDFFLQGEGPHTVNISYYPTNNDVIQSEHNLGIDIIFIPAEKDSNDASTPGFEFILILTSIIIFIAIRWRRN